jgi:hypothetical protein
VFASTNIYSIVSLVYTDLNTKHLALIVFHQFPNLSIERIFFNGRAILLSLRQHALNWECVSEWIQTNSLYLRTMLDYFIDSDRILYDAHESLISTFLLATILLGWSSDSFSLLGPFIKLTC